MANQFDLIKNALIEAKTSGLSIIKGFCFDLTGNSDKPLGVNWLGSIYWNLRDKNLNKEQFKTCNMTQIYNYLDVDLHWLYCFGMGFDQGHVLSILHPKTLEVIGKDSISEMGLKIRREFL